MSVKIDEATSPQEIAACWPVIQVLRPHVVESTLVDRVTQQQKEEGYRLLYIRQDDLGVCAILGFRVLNFLWSGKTMYIDDFCTLPSTRGKGYGGALLDRAAEIAKELDCEGVSLDSGYTRNDAHRLYLNKKFQLASHHFHRNLK
ncbi:uncharacterized N-acetyltransferase YhdJ [Folsomia candida]|uniref:Putative N-acetyltransferase YhdJ n=1 Tax=Folsomia candida TaxID=158441 RepID=A0A226DG06_FOLCA|nr:uncharacterized N-acetyltransferase YhdJ [Folsomia candida]OXA43627.1 putative N-acetyltransferase YhdJ [Folsomia candida]